jgi:hypothetical protein
MNTASTTTTLTLQQMQALGHTITTASVQGSGPRPRQCSTCGARAYSHPNVRGVFTPSVAMRRKCADNVARFGVARRSR